MLIAALIVSNLAAFALACALAFRLYRWEKVLRFARITFYYKTRPVMSPRLIDVLQWALVMDRDTLVKGYAFFKRDKVTVALKRAIVTQGSKTQVTHRSSTPTDRGEIGERPDKVTT